MTIEFIESLQELSEFAQERSLSVQQACVAGDEEERLRLLIPRVIKCAELTADILHSVALLSRDHGSQIPMDSVQAGEDAMDRVPRSIDAEGIPTAWSPVYWDLLWDQDCLRYEPNDDGRWIIANTPDAGAAWVVTWPEAPRVVPGERWQLTVDATSEGVSGESCARLSFFSDDTRRLLTGVSESVTSHERTRLRIESTVPEKASRMRVELVSKGVIGEVAFSSCMLLRLS